MRFARFIFAVLTPVAIASTSAGCSDPVPPTPQGAWKVNFSQTPNAAKCRVMGHSANIGGISETARTAVIPSGGQAIADSGEAPVTVTCTVAGAGPFYVEGSVNQGARGLEVAISKIDASARESSPAIGSVSYVDEHTVASYRSTECKFYFEEGRTRIAPGQVWLSFSCPEISAASTLAATCGLSESYVIFENCNQAVPTP
jgi:hypothetical protein